MITEEEKLHEILERLEFHILMDPFQPRENDGPWAVREAAILRQLEMVREAKALLPKLEIAQEMRIRRALLEGW